MSQNQTEEPNYIRTVTRNQCIGCGAIAATIDRIDHEDYCPEEHE